MRGKTLQNGNKINYSCLTENGKEMVLCSCFAFQSIGLVASALKQTSHSPLRFLENFFLSQLRGLDLLRAADRPLLFSGFCCKLRPCCPHCPAPPAAPGSLQGWSLSHFKVRRKVPLLLRHRVQPDHSTVFRTTSSHGFHFATCPQNGVNIPFAVLRR